MVICNNNRDNPFYDNTTTSSTSANDSFIVDAKTLVAQTQDRMQKALEGRYLYDSSLKDSQDFLSNHVNSKISLVIMYVDLAGSNNMSMTLQVDKMVTIIRAFTHEMTSTVIKLLTRSLPWSSCSYRMNSDLYPAGKLLHHLRILTHNHDSQSTV